MDVHAPFSEFILGACKDFFRILMHCFIFNKDCELGLKQHFQIFLFWC